MRSAQADDRRRVVLLEPAHLERTLEVHVRLRGELEAAGFDVVVSRVPAGEDAKEVGEALARELHPLAVLYLVEKPSNAALDAAPDAAGGEIWISDRLQRRSYIVKFDLQPGDAPTNYSRIAVEAVEVLRANLAELSVTRTEEPLTEVPAPAPVSPAPQSQHHGSRVSASLHAGAGLLQGFHGLGPVWTPLVRVGVSVPPELLRAPLTLDVLGVAAFYGARARLETPAGSARVRQSLAALELWGRFAPRAAAEPFVSLSGGAYRTEVEGSAADPALENSENTWSLATGIGTGIWAEPAPGLAVIMNAELLVAWARTIVEVADQEVATAGAPMLLVSVSAAGVF